MLLTRNASPSSHLSEIAPPRHWIIEDQQQSIWAIRLYSAIANSGCITYMKELH